MSSSQALVLPTAIRHSTLFSSFPRYRYRCHCHKLLAFAIVALLALTVAPANAADIPPRHRQYKYTRTLAHENVNRAPAAHLRQPFDVPSLEQRGILDRPSANDKNNINATNWTQFFSSLSSFMQWWKSNFKTDPFSTDNDRRGDGNNGNGNGNGNNNGNGNGNGKADKTTSTPTPARTTAKTTAKTTAVPAAITRTQTTTSTPRSTPPATTSPASSTTAVTFSPSPSASPASSASKTSVVFGSGFDGVGDVGNDLSADISSSTTDMTSISISVPSSTTTESGPVDPDAQTANSAPDRKWVIGLVIGLLFLSFTCCGLGYIFFKKRRAREREREQTSSTSSEMHIVEKGQDAGMVHTPAPYSILPSPPPVTFAALPPTIPVAAATPTDNRRDSRRVSRMSMANTRPTTPSSYLSSEFSEKSLFQYEPDPSIGVPVDYPIAIHVPPRVAKALAKRDAARNEQSGRELVGRERAMFQQPDPSNFTHTSEGSSGTGNTDGHGLYFGLPPTGYNGNNAESSNAHSAGHNVYSDLNRWSAASSRLSGTIPIHEAFPLPPEPSTSRSTVFRVDSMPPIAGMISGHPSEGRGQEWVSHPLPPLPPLPPAPQQQDDPFLDDNIAVLSDSSTQLHNPFRAGRASQASLITDESTNAGGGSSQQSHIVGAVTATARVTPAARVVYSSASMSSDATIQPYHRSSDASMSPITATDPNADLNPFGDQHSPPMRSQVADTGVVMTGVEDAHATDQHDESQSSYQRSIISTSSSPQTPSTPRTARTFGR